MAAAHVLLDPFPAAGLLPTLQALAIGVPVVTQPGEHMSSRFALSLYRTMGVTELVAADAETYVQLALSMAHQPSARTAVVNQLLAHRHKLFEKEAVVADWRRFLDERVARTRRSQA